MKVAIVQRAAIRSALPEHRDLRVEAQHRTPHVGLPKQGSSIVCEIAGREVVAAVDNEVVFGEQSQRIGRGQSCLVLYGNDRRVESRDCARGARRFGRPER